MYRYIYSALTCSILIVTPAYSEEIKIPVGDIKWDDNIVQVIEKINSIQGIEEAALSIWSDKTNSENHTYSTVDHTSITSVSKKDDILRKLSVAGELYFNQSAISSAKSHFVIDGIDYLIMGGQVLEEPSGLIISSNLYIEAKSVVIINVPFKITVLFKGSLGLMAKDINKIVAITISDKKYYLPFYLSQVKLTPIETYLDDAAVNKINEIIYDKYKGLLSDECKHYENKKVIIGCRNVFSDENSKHTLTIKDHKYITERSYEIIYTNEKLEEELRRFYKEYAVTSEKNKIKERYKNKKDASNSL